MSFTLLDFIFMVIILFIAIHGAIVGFIDELFGKVAIILALFIAIMFYSNIAVYINEHIVSEFASSLLAFILLFIAVFLFVKIIQHFIGGLFESEIMGSLDHVLGFLLGAIEGLLIISVVLIIFYAQPWFDVSGVLQGSFFDKVLNERLSAPTNSVQEMLTFTKYYSSGSLNV
ncbi:MAG: colicin V production protein [Treponema sp. CETP13]|nr:MAG: colicin V production protein [Treponema sp. CETP13]